MKNKHVSANVIQATRRPHTMHIKSKCYNTISILLALIIIIIIIIIMNLFRPKAAHEQRQKYTTNPKIT